ncbi:MAG: SAM-dependent methyltransferase [Candidatus Anaerobiospirillum merdipullorum]|uniref:SAM-dependent methyltransferase n=1 Tax=Candidatus Anaerobiospirillum merdipullorum TaxID=2838450 RepID=A0A9E2KM21_9GAMM|nr:SAM-dependent methyltransferase [Candidatus Anaerobiospirillum merdipullorum]
MGDKAVADFYNADKLSAIAAISEAQKLAFAPLLFQCTRCLLDLGVLDALDKAGKDGLSLNELAHKLELSTYAVGVMLDMGLSGHLLYEKQGRFYLAKVGYFLLHDEMTRVNFNFTADVCYAAASHLKEALVSGKPAGLQVFAPWETIYPYLSKLPSPARESWFAFDHFYSDAAFKAVLPLIFASGKVNTLFDVGGNTGRFAAQCLQYDAKVKVKILDLPEQIALVEHSDLAAQFADRLSFAPLNVLTPDPFPQGADVWWMSQFLDCFAPEQIVHILTKIKVAAKAHSRIFILELCADAQRFEAASYSLNATSLYFTCLANGNSRFYRLQTLKDLIARAGLTVVATHNDIGRGHTLLEVAL